MRLTIALLFISTFAFSQANFIEEGENNATLGLGLYSGGGQTDLIIGGGYSPNGLFDITGVVQRGTVDDDFGLNDAYILSIYTQARYFIVKEDDLPIQLSINAAGGLGRVSSDEINLLDWDVTSRQFSIGTTAYLDFDSTSDVVVQPYGSIYYNILQLKVDTNGFGSGDDSDTTINFGLGANIILELDTNRLAIAPSIFIADDATRFGVDLSYIFD